nr:MAG TPA: hypothetical protein [Caudoviricetes sp.]
MNPLFNAIFLSYFAATVKANFLFIFSNSCKGR